MTKIQKVLLTGKTHTKFSRDGEDRLDVRLTTPNNPKSVYAFDAIQAHPTAEQLFAGAWSACYISAIDLVAKAKKVTLPHDLSVEIEVDLGMNGAAYLLQARINVRAPGVPREVAEAIAHAADEICPYSKATRGNIDVSLNVVEA